MEPVHGSRWVLGTSRVEIELRSGRPQNGPGELGERGKNGREERKRRAEEEEEGRGKEGRERREGPKEGRLKIERWG